MVTFYLGTNNNENDEKCSNQVQEPTCNETATETIPPNNKISHHHHQRIKQLKIESSNYNVPDLNSNHLSSNSDLSSTESDQHYPCKIRHSKKSHRQKNTSQTENISNVNSKIINTL